MQKKAEKGSAPVWKWFLCSVLSPWCSCCFCRCRCRIWKTKYSLIALEDKPVFLPAGPKQTASAVACARFFTHWYVKFAQIFCCHYFLDKKIFCTGINRCDQSDNCVWQQAAHSAPGLIHSDILNYLTATRCSGFLRHGPNSETAPPTASCLGSLASKTVGVPAATALPLRSLPQTTASAHGHSPIIARRNWGCGPS